MRIIITGATGFVGSHFVRYFSKRGHRVIALGRSKAPLALEKYAEYRKWDALGSPILPLSSSDMFIHCSGHVDFRGEESTILMQNVEGTRRALAIARKAALFVYISSASVYGLSDMVRNANEKSRFPEKFSNAYAKSKALAEQEMGNRRSLILRPHAIYGPGDRTLLRKLLSHVWMGRLPMLGDGRNRISVTHIGNICDALAGLQKRNATGIFNVCDESPLSMALIYSEIIREFGYDGTFKVPLSIARLLGAAIGPLGITDITQDLISQLTQDSTIDRGKLDSKGIGPRLTFSQGIHDARKWVDSLGGRGAYLQNPSPSWEGKLFTY